MQIPRTIKIETASFRAERGICWASHQGCVEARRALSLKIAPRQESKGCVKRGKQIPHFVRDDARIKIILKGVTPPLSASEGEESAGLVTTMHTNRTGHGYCVYVMASKSRVIYVGVTRDLHKRVFEHKEGLIPGFTSRYRVHRLVHFERYTNISSAITREKELKGGRREKKLALIEAENPLWEDLAEHWYDNVPSFFGIRKSHDQ